MLRGLHLEHNHAGVEYEKCYSTENLDNRVTERFREYQN